MYTEFLECLTSFMDKEDIKANEPMSKHTSFRVGGPARVFLTVRSEEILRKVLIILQEKNLSYFVDLVKLFIAFAIDKRSGAEYN